MNDSSSKHSAQLYHACARLASAAPSCHYRLSRQTLKAEKELWDLIKKLSTNRSVCIKRIPYFTQLRSMTLLTLRGITLKSFDAMLIMERISTSAIFFRVREKFR